MPTRITTVAAGFGQAAVCDDAADRHGSMLAKAAALGVRQRVETAGAPRLGHGLARFDRPAARAGARA